MGPKPGAGLLYMEGYRDATRDAHDLFVALDAVNKIIAEGARTGFRPLDGDWAERLFQSQQATSAALRKALNASRACAIAEEPCSEGVNSKDAG